MAYRAELLSKANKNPGLQAAMRDRCTQDILYWLNTFAWIFEPRAQLQNQHGSITAHLPFLTYEYQDELILEYPRRMVGEMDLVNE